MAINNFGYDTHGYTTDDIKRLQEKAGIAQDGIWGPQTQNAYDNGYNGLTREAELRNYAAQQQEAGRIRGLVGSAGASNPDYSSNRNNLWNQQNGYQAGAAADLHRINDQQAPKSYFNTEYPITANGYITNNLGYNTQGFTTDQIRQMQRNAGIMEDGIWGPQTQKAYESGFRPDSPTNWQVANQGAVLQDVNRPTPKSYLDTEYPITANGYIINSLGYNTQGFTDEQIRQMQRNAGIAEDGIWGPQTQRAYESGYMPDTMTDWQLRNRGAMLQDVGRAMSLYDQYTTPPKY